jgi:hypothetical protein
VGRDFAPVLNHSHTDLFPSTTLSILDPEHVLRLLSVVVSVDQHGSEFLDPSGTFHTWMEFVVVEFETTVAVQSQPFVLAGRAAVPSFGGRLDWFHESLLRLDRGCC